MKSYTAGEIASLLAKDCEAVCKALLPNGKKQGSEWCTGDIHDSDGKSLKVHLSGSRAGLWSDFAEGVGGDLLDLWAYKKHIDIAKAIKEAKDYLGLSNDNFYEKKEHTYTPPQRPQGLKKPHGDAKQWLQDRGITEETYTLYQVGCVGPVLVYPHIVDGLIMSLRFRDTSKPKKQAFSNSPNTPHTLWGWQTLPKDCRSVVLSEGYEDSMVWRQYGYTSMSLPYGAGSGNKQKWIDYDFERLERFDTIYLSMDMDESGTKSIRDIVKRLGVYRCRIISLPHKDSNKCLDEGVTKEEIDACIENSVYLDPEYLRKPLSYKNDVLKKFFPSDSDDVGFYLPWNEGRELGFRPAELILHSGFNGAGKSMWISWLTILMMMQNYKVSTASMELKTVMLLYRMLKQITGLTTPSEAYISKCLEWLNDDKLWLFSVTGTAKAEMLLDTMMYARKRYGVDVFMIDSLMKCGIAETDLDGQKEFMDRLTDFKNETEAQIHLVVHQRKPEGVSEIKANPTKYGIKGSGSITDLTDTIVHLKRNKSKELKIRQHIAGRQNIAGIEIPKELLKLKDVMVICDKQRNGDWEGSFGLYYDRSNYRYREYLSQKTEIIVPFSNKDNKDGNQ